MRFLRFLAALVGAVLLLSGTAARSQSVTVSRIASVNGKTVITVNNGASFVPYLFYAAQVRLDYEYEALGRSWTAANDALYDASFQYGTDGFTSPQNPNNLAFRSVIIPVHWGDIQPTDPGSPTNDPTNPSYNWTYLDNIIAKAAARGLSVQLIWGGSDVCGWDYAPYWVDNGTDPRFPFVSITGTNQVAPNKGQPYTGKALNLGSANLVNYESAALQAMMSEIYKDYTQDPQHRTPVMMVQVENEPDGVGSFSNLISNWSDPQQIAAYGYAGGQFDAVKHLLNVLGTDVNTAKYSVVTRCNLGGPYRSAELMNSHSYPGCNIFGVDNYDISSQRTLVTNGNLDLLSAPFNVTHQPEGPGAFAGVVSLILTNFADGGGFGVYNLRSYSTNGDNDGLFDTVTPGPGTSWDTWTVRNGPASTSVQQLNSLLYNDHVDWKIALATRGQAAAFNAQVANPATFTSGATDTEKVGPYQVTCTGGYGFAMMDDASHLLLMNVGGGTSFQIHNVPGSPTATVGVYNAAQVWTGSTPAANYHAGWSGGVYTITMPYPSTVARITLPETPYAAHALPGTIPATDYDKGGAGYAYNLAGHDAAPASSYRPDSTNNLHQPTGLKGGWAIGNTYAGQWYRYTVYVPASAFYNVSFAASSGNNPGQFDLQDDEGTDLTGPVTGPSGNWSAFSTVTTNDLGRPMTCYLTAGVHTLQLNILTSPQSYCADIASFSLRLADSSSGSQYQIVPANSPQNALNANGSNVQIAPEQTGSGFSAETQASSINAQQWQLHSGTAGTYQLSPQSAAAAGQDVFLDAASGKTVTVDDTPSLWSLTPTFLATDGPGTFSLTASPNVQTLDLGVVDADTWSWSLVGVGPADGGAEQQWLISAVAPPTPQIISAVIVGGAVQLTFNQVPGATAYLVYQAWGSQSEGASKTVLEFPDPSVKTEPSTVNSASPSQITVTDTNPGGAIYYQVAALGPQGLSAPSNEVIASAK